MKYKPTSVLFALWLALALALVPTMRAAAADATEPPKQETPAPADPAVAPAPEKTEEPAAAAAGEKKADGELRELGATEEKPADSEKKPVRRYGPRLNRSHSEAPPFGNHTVSAESTQNEAVSIMGNTQVDGHVTDAAVSVFGNTTVGITGTVDDAAVSVFGTTTVNGKVRGEAVAVFGDVVLGSEADVGGEVVAVFGKVIRAPGAQTHSGVQQVAAFGPFRNLGAGLRAWIDQCLLMVRPLWIGKDLGWIWVIAACFMIFYLLLALLFPSGIEKSVEVLEQKPGGTFLAALLTMLLTPVVMVLLVITGVGIILLPFLGVGLFFATLFGKAAVMAWLGRRVTRLFGAEVLANSIVAAVFFGCLIAWALYLVPVLGFLLYKFFGILGLGMVVYRLVLSMQREKPVPAVAMAGVPVPPPLPGEIPVSAAILPAVISASTLPRAGFWRRIGAVLLDIILIGMLCALLDNIWHRFGNAVPLWFAIYHVVMWATKGTTIGGIVCGLKVVRLDDRPLDWGVAIVRCLGAFLSLVVAGLGFIWVAFDDEKQSWHDKIAGTTIVRVPKGVSLL